jgi:hypothetical protein
MDIKAGDMIKLKNIQYNFEDREYLEGSGILFNKPYQVLSVVLNSFEDRAEYLYLVGIGEGSMLAHRFEPVCGALGIVFEYEKDRDNAVAEDFLRGL